MPRPCPECQRPNGPHRLVCLYCGAALEEDAVAETQERAEVDEEALEEAVFAALRGQGTVRQAAASLPTPTLKPKKISLEPPSGQETGPVAKLDQSDAEQLLKGVQEESVLEAAKLPLGRRPWVLMVDGMSEESLAQELSEITGIDHITTRMVACSAWDRPLIWAVEREGLDALAAKITDRLGMAASVLQTGRLRECVDPVGVLRMESESYICTERPIWMGANPQGAEETREELKDLRLIVPGQVAIRRFQEVRRGRWSRNKGNTERREIGERRVVLMDLHTPKRLLRVILGVTDFRGMPGFHEGSGALSIRGLEEALEESFPGVRVQGKRVCYSHGARALQETESDRRNFELSGWSTWEEHTLLCRVHSGCVP